MKRFLLAALLVLPAVVSAQAIVRPGAGASLPAADATHDGYVTTGTQTFAGAKTFTGDITFGTLTIIYGDDSGADIEGTVNITGHLGVGTGLNVDGDSGLTTVHGLTIGNVNDRITLSLACNVTLATSAIAAGTTATQNITCTGAAAGSECIVGAPATLEAGLMQFCLASAANTITLRTANVSAGSITPAAAQIVKVRFLNSNPIE